MCVPMAPATSPSAATRLPFAAASPALVSPFLAATVNSKPPAPTPTAAAAYGATFCATAVSGGGGVVS